MINLYHENFTKIATTFFQTRIFPALTNTASITPFLQMVFNLINQSDFSLLTGVLFKIKI